MSEVRCRFAPAPSGSIHVGNARTALFSWLTARHLDGTFVLRVEDTDASRVTEEAVAGVLEALDWLGLDHDEGPSAGGPHAPYRQSERGEIYQAKLDELLSSGAAYRCYCTKEELEERRKAAQAAGQAPGYDGRCRSLTDEQRAAHEAEGRESVMRFAMPDKDRVIQDLVRGEVTFAAGSLPDFVLQRSDGSPTFLLAVAVDDMLMEITHVIRGEDLLASAPRNLAVMEALGATEFPVYAHLPLIVGADRQPLSKRHGSVSIEAFREQGFLPEALVNYLALLGWSLDDQTEFFTLAELQQHFELARVSSNPSAFDTQKLEWMNNHYIQQLDHDDLAARLVHPLTEAGLLVDPELLTRAVPLVAERMKTLAEAPDLLRFLFTDDITPNEKAQKLIDKAGPGYLRSAVDAFTVLEPWSAESVGESLDALAATAGLNRTKGWQPIRAAVTGSNISPPLPESLELLGKERTIARLEPFAS